MDILLGVNHALLLTVEESVRMASLTKLDWVVCKVLEIDVVDLTRVLIVAAAGDLYGNLGQRRRLYDSES